MTFSFLERISTRRVAVVGVGCAVLTTLAGCAYMYWGWSAVFLNPAGYFPEMRPAGWNAAEARQRYLEAVRWARACRYAAFGFGGVAIGSLAIGAWRTRQEWRSWPWPSVVMFAPALFALVLTLLGAPKGGAVLTLGIGVVATFAALFDLWRVEPGAPSRVLCWAVLVTSLLSILLRPLIPWG